MKSPDAMQCPGCFETKTNTACERCGYDETLKRSPLVLPHHTLLSNGRYQIGRVLGRPGGFGITYLAFDSRLQSLVAIKEYLPRELSARDGDHLTVSPHSGEEGELFQYGVGKFLEEARTLAKFDHPNVVRVRDFFEENGTAYLVMDYCRGLPLSQYVSQQEGGKVNINAAISILQPLLDALRELHKKGYLHRDVKPQNIYLSESGKPILLDFGAARQAMGDKSRSLSVVLSEGYAPLEQYQRNGMQGPWTDVYGAVATFYNLITGQTPPSAIDRINNPTAELNGSSAFDERIRLILNKGLHPDHALRIQSVESLQRLLDTNAQSDYNTHKDKDEPISVNDNKTAYGAGVVKTDQSTPHDNHPAWNEAAPYYISALTGQNSLDIALNDPDPKKLYWLTSIGFMISIVGASVFGATLVNELNSYKNSDAVDVMVISGFAGLGAAYAILSSIPPYSRMLIYRRARVYLPIFQKLYAGINIHNIGVDYVLFPIAWLGYWGLNRELAISLAGFFLIGSSPAILSFISGPKSHLAAILYKVTDNSLFYLLFWTLISLRYDRALYQRITILINPYLEQGINDPAIIFQKTRPRLIYGFLCMSIFLSLVVGIGKVVDPSIEEISAHLESSNGNYDKAYTIGLRMYENGKYEEAAEWLQPLSRSEYAPAQYLTGILYESGQAPTHLAKDEQRAYSLYKKAAEAGYPLAKLALARSYQYGMGVEPDPNTAIKWYLQAVDDKLPEASYSLGLMYYKGSGMKKDPSKSFEYISKAAAMDYPAAVSFLAACYQDGIGTKKNARMALNNYEKALSMGDSDAQYAMGINYYNGELVSKDTERGIDLLTQSATSGHRQAQYALGAILVANDGSYKDVETGREWLKKASSQGLEDATKLLTRINIR